jgi:stage V sporulation protein S
MDKYIEMKISAKANVRNTAKLIEEVIQNDLGVKIAAIGAGAVNQAVKAIAAARDSLYDEWIDLIAFPKFEKIKDADGKEITAMQIFVEARDRWDDCV